MNSKCSRFNEHQKGSLGFDSTDRQFTLIQWAVKEPFQALVGALQVQEHPEEFNRSKLEITIEGDTGSVNPFDRGSRSANSFLRFDLHVKS